MDAYGEDDFGPETDVDVVDDAMMMHSPTLATSKDMNLPTIDDFNLKTSSDIITMNNDNTMQLLDNNLHHNNIKNDLIKEHDNNINDVENDFHLNNHNHNNHHQIIDDNKLFEATGGIGMIGDADAQIELNSNNGELNHALTKKEIDFSEKREYSFECEEYEKELNTLSDAALELMSTVSDAFSDPLATPVLTTEIDPIGEVDLIEPKNGKF